MRTSCLLPCLIVAVTTSLTLPEVFAHNDVGSATLRTSVSFRSDSSESSDEVVITTKALTKTKKKAVNKEKDYTNIDQEASPSNHATSSSSFALLSNGNPGASSNIGPSYNHRRDEDRTGSYGYPQGYILTGSDPPLRATTYGPPSPVGMKYRMRRPVSPHHTTNIQHRFRGNVFPPKHSDLHYKTNPTAAEPPILKFPVQHDVPAYRKFYKKPVEVPQVRKAFVKPKAPFYPDVFNKDGYEEHFSTATFDDEYSNNNNNNNNYNYNNNNRQPVYQEVSGEEQERSVKSEGDFDNNFSKSFYDNFFSKPIQVNNKEQNREIYYNPGKPAPSPARNLSKYYKKPINHYVTKHQSSEYKSGQIFSEPLQYSRPIQYKRPPISSSSLSTSASSPSGEWTPINAPQGAVPAKSYDIPAPDLSTDRRSQNKRGVYEDSLRHEVVVGTNKFNKAGNSEEIVSAVVMVKQ